MTIQSASEIQSGDMSAAMKDSGLDAVPVAEYSQSSSKGVS
jgi:hypothetical protein